MDDTAQNHQFFAGLEALAEAAFPKRCNNCGRVFSTAQQFIGETGFLRPGVTGLKQSVDDNDLSIVEVYRNCPCGSTLMDLFSDRRDISDGGQDRRRRFDELRAYLEAKGLDEADAHSCLLRLLRGQATEADKELIVDRKQPLLREPGQAELPATKPGGPDTLPA